MYGLQLLAESKGRLKRGTVYVTLVEWKKRGTLRPHRRPAPRAGGLPRRLYQMTGHGRRVLDAWTHVAPEAGAGGGAMSESDTHSRGKLPGSLLLSIAERLCSRQAYDAVGRATVADLQHEYASATDRRAWICLRGYIALLKALAVCFATWPVRTFVWLGCSLTHQDGSSSGNYFRGLACRWQFSSF